MGQKLYKNSTLRFLMKLKTFKNLFIYLLLFIPLSLGMISCSGNNKSNAKFKDKISADIIPPIKAVAALGQLSPSGEIRQLAAPISQFGSSPRVVEILVKEGQTVIIRPYEYHWSFNKKKAQWMNFLTKRFKKRAPDIIT